MRTPRARFVPSVRLELTIFCLTLHGRRQMHCPIMLRGHRVLQAAGFEPARISPSDFLVVYSTNVL